MPFVFLHGTAFVAAKYESKMISYQQFMKKAVDDSKRFTCQK